MEGVTILNTIYEYAMNFSEWWIGGFLGAAFVLMALGVATVNSSNVLPVISFCLCIVCVVTGVTLGVCQEETDEIIDTKYQVIVEDSVSFSDFNEHYEIIKQDGQIYTVREIEGK